MISIEVSPSQLEAALAAIKADHDDATVTFAEGSTTAGHIHTSQIDADFVYKQRTDYTGTLLFDNEVKHGLYKFTSDATIGQHILALLAKIPSPADIIAQAAAEKPTVEDTPTAEELGNKTPPPAEDTPAS
jgi:hypothetical protein